MSAIYDVVIIGAGYSGLSAGLYFKDCNVNNVIVLEARPRVGGRVCTENIKLDDGTETEMPPCSTFLDRAGASMSRASAVTETNIETGGAYVGNTQNRLLRLCNRFGIKTYHINMRGKSILEYNSRLSCYEGTIATNVGISTLLDLNHVIHETDKLAKNINTINIQSSNISKHALNKYDNMTVEEWLQSICTNTEAIEQYKGAIRAVVYAQPSQISLLFWLNYVKNANGSTMHLVETKNGAQDSKIIGGAQSVCEAMQKEIGFEKVKLKHCVKLIEQNEEYITVHCTNSFSFKSKYLLCSIPPALYQQIEWKPKLNWKRLEICKNMPMAVIFKTNTYFKTAFWREDGLNGLSFCCGENNNNSPICVTFDDCKPDGTVPSLMGLTLNTNKYINMSYEQRKQSVLQQYCRIFKNKKAMTECIGYFEKKWSGEIYSGGGPVGVTNCNVMSQHYWNILKEAENEKIYFCGTELSDQWLGYMDGAIQSGEREANKITKILAKHNKSINVKYIYDADKEPECENCPLPFVNLQRSWIERNILPSAKQAKIALLLLTLLLLSFFAIQY